MTVVDLPFRTRLSVTKSAAKDTIQPYGDEAAAVQTLLVQASQSLRLASLHIAFDRITANQASLELLLSKLDELESRSTSVLLRDLPSHIPNDILYEYILGSMPKKVETLKAEIVDAGKGKPRFRIDVEID